MCRLGKDWGTSMISKTAEYALRAVACLAGSLEAALFCGFYIGTNAGSSSLFACFLQDLVCGEIVRSRPGPGGGYELNAAPVDITILDIINTVDPIERIKRCRSV